MEWTDHLLFVALFLLVLALSEFRTQKVCRGTHGVSAIARAREVFQAGPCALPQEPLLPGNDQTMVKTLLFCSRRTTNFVALIRRLAL